MLAFLDGNRILLNRRADAAGEMWEIIGGGIEKDELPIEAICREVQEEIGYALGEKDNLRQIKKFRFKSNKLTANVSLFAAIFPGLQAFSDSDETFVSDLKLFSFEDALNLTLLPITYEIIAKNYLS